MQKRLKEYNDSELFALIKSKDVLEREAFSELYDRHSPRVYAYCRKFFNDSDKAKDAFQEVFIRFYQSLPKLEEMTNLPAFLIRITRNCCISMKTQERETVSFEDYMVQSESFIKTMEQKELLALVDMALGLIPEDMRDILILREYTGLSYIEIAEVSEDSIDNVKVKIHRARKKVREILAPYMKELKLNE